MADRELSIVDPFSIDQRKARAYSESTLVPKHLQGNLPNCLAAMMMADEMGDSRLAVMQNIYFVHDRPAWITAYMVARANRSGKFLGPLRWRTLTEWPETKVECYAYLREAPEDDRTVSIAVDMKTAKESGWITYDERDRAGKKTGNTLTHARWATPVMAEQMLRWRSAAWLIRLYAPEVMMGLPTREELEDISGEMIDVTPPMPKLSDFAPAKAPAAPAEEGLVDTATAWAQKGSYSLQSFLTGLRADQKTALKPVLDTHLKPIAEAADKANEQSPEAARHGVSSFAPSPESTTR